MSDCPADDLACEKRTSLMDAKMHMLKTVDAIYDGMNQKLQLYEDKISSLTHEIKTIKETIAPKGKLIRLFDFYD